jgi:hypothetical protein
VSAPDLLVVSHGIVHDDPLISYDIAPDVQINVSDWFRDPHIDPELRNLTGKHDRVVNKVLATEGVYGFLNHVYGLTEFLLEHRARIVTVAFACVGGRHRSVVIADMLGMRAEAAGFVTVVRHLHIDRPVRRRGEVSTSAEEGKTANHTIEQTDKGRMWCWCDAGGMNEGSGHLRGRGSCIHAQTNVGDDAND